MVPFAAGVHDAVVVGLMPSYNELSQKLRMHRADGTNLSI